MNADVYLSGLVRLHVWPPFARPEHRRRWRRRRRLFHSSRGFPLLFENLFQKSAENRTKPSAELAGKLNCKQAAIESATRFACRLSRA